MKIKSTTSQKPGTKQPYSGGARKRAGVPMSAVPSGSGRSTPPELPAYLASTDPGSDPGNGAVLNRDVYTPYVRKIFPGFEPQSDWELATLATTKFRGTNEEIRAWLDRKRVLDMSAFGPGDIIERMATKTLNMWVENSGATPAPGAKSVFTQPIPDSSYSIRLFPGSISAAEYCMDFVVTETGQPVNSPFEFELWAIPHPDATHLTPFTGQLMSIERAHGIKQEDILPGEEKFILRDGLTCLLRRPGKKPVRFTVPTRRRTESTEAVDVLSFPTSIDP
ncbi:hypothetical protein PYCCODRAFT_1478080 [Trametes coccinea BRFM310]|uniref:Uncharacterized protein n=1 Tax=Trametes coccinea (strain BRFM310) TaxID=1353009 RepID=A0A1Y2IL79_TRAC3|nr:hypothetical protein PYCCODRAFT_1478080 [Trametes coccinea BRFM310]